MMTVDMVREVWGRNMLMSLFHWKLIDEHTLRGLLDVKG